MKINPFVAVFCLLICFESKSEIFHIRYNSGTQVKVLAYQTIEVYNRLGKIIFNGKTDKYGRIRIIRTDGYKIVSRVLNVAYALSPVIIRNNLEKKIIVLKTTATAVKSTSGQ